MSRVAQLVKRVATNPRVAFTTLLFAAVMLLAGVQRLAVLLGHDERLAGSAGVSWPARSPSGCDSMRSSRRW
jgi:hypothetical protein